jgi:hypothetical protein
MTCATSWASRRRPGSVAPAVVGPRRMRPSQQYSPLGLRPHVRRRRRSSGCRDLDVAETGAETRLEPGSRGRRDRSVWPEAGCFVRSICSRRRGAHGWPVQSPVGRGVGLAFGWSVRLARTCGAPAGPDRRRYPRCRSPAAQPLEARPRKSVRGCRPPMVRRRRHRGVSDITNRRSGPHMQLARVPAPSVFRRDDDHLTIDTSKAK